MLCRQTMEIDAQGLRAWASWVQKGSVECRINQRKQKENAMDDVKTKLSQRPQESFLD